MQNFLYYGWVKLSPGPLDSIIDTWKALWMPRNFHIYVSKIKKWKWLVTYYWNNRSGCGLLLVRGRPVTRGLLLPVRGRFVNTQAIYQTWRPLTSLKGSCDCRKCQLLSGVTIKPQHFMIFKVFGVTLNYRVSQKKLDFRISAFYGFSCDFWAFLRLSWYYRGLPSHIKALSLIST